MSETRTFASVSRVQGRLRKLLEPALAAKPFWLRAELSSVSHRNGRMYCDLVEMKEGRVIAKLRCTVWPRELKEIKTRLHAARLDELLADGNEVGLRCMIQYHELYGMSVTAVDVDPHESVGALERKKQQIVARLRGENLLDKNALQRVSRLPKRVGLVASRGTAGYKDFVTTIAASRYGITVVVADARVEGEDTERSVLRAFGQLAKLDVDLVILLRGGGSRLSLSYLDNEAIARAIAEYRYPVWTAIGHEVDTCVADSVAHTSFKTPTAVAEHLVARYVEADEELRTASAQLVRLTTQRLRLERERVESARRLVRDLATRGLRGSRLAAGSHSERFRLLVRGRMTKEYAGIAHARSKLSTLAKQRAGTEFRALDEKKKSLGKTTARALSRSREEVDYFVMRIQAPTAMNRLRSERQRLTAWRQILRAADPARNLERGYALVYGADGAIVRECQSVAAGQILRVQLAGGKIVTTVDSCEVEVKNDYDQP